MIIKMVLTVIIILALVFTFVSYFPVTGLLTKAGIDDFNFASKSQEAAPAEEISAGEIVFELRAKRYSSFIANANGEISLKGKTIAEGNGVNINTNSLIKLENYYGSFSLDSLERDDAKGVGSLRLNGSVSKIHLPDATFTTNSIFLSSTAEELDVKSIEGKELRISGLLGTIKVGRTDAQSASYTSETAFTGTLILTNVVAGLLLECFDASGVGGCDLVISGKAASVEIPEAGLRFK